MTGFFGAFQFPQEMEDSIELLKFSQYSEVKELVMFTSITKVLYTYGISPRLHCLEFFD